MKNLFFVLFCLVLLGMIYSVSRMFPNQHSCEDISLCKIENVNNQTLLEGSFVSDLFDTSGFPPRWACGEWSAFQGWTSIFSDLVIFLSYFGIPCTLLFFIYRASPVNLIFKRLIILFVAFIISCGLTHLVEVILFWEPVYNFSILLKFLTAAISFTTFVALVRNTPDLLKLRTPEQLQEIIQSQTRQLRDQNNLLNVEIQERKKIEDNLEKSLEANRKLYMENQHRIKNNLQMISSLIYLKSIKKNEAEQADYHDLNQRIRSIGKVHELLMKNSASPDNEAKTYLNELVSELSNIHSESSPTIFLNVDPEIKIDSNELIHCGLILSEFFSNSVEHAFKYQPSPEIHLILKKRQDRIEFVLRDNGQGFDENKVSSESFGLDLMKSFASNLGGVMELISFEGGTQARIEWTAYE